MKHIILTFILLISFVQSSSLELTGSVVSDNQKMISSRYMGFIKELNVGEGDVVKKGDLLYKIDSREIDSKKQQALMSLGMYENQHMNIELNLARYRRLLRKDMVSRYEVENLELKEKLLKAQINIAKAQLAEVKNQYRYLEVKAPNNGVIVKKNIRVGEMAMPGMPALVLSDLSRLKIIVEISEENLKQAKVGKIVVISIPSMDIKEEGVISAIIPSSNPMTHTFKVKVSFLKKQIDVYPGMYAKVIL